MDRPWFTEKHFSSLVIRQNMSLADHRVVKVVTITDAGYIAAFAARIERLPTNGDKMISFSGEAEHIELQFFSGDGKQEIEVIQRGFKTPSTGFNLVDEHEKELYGEIEGLLYPSIGKILPKVVGLELSFGDFSLCYLGTRFEDHAPVSLSFHIAEFRLTDRGGGMEVIGISAGQLPPRPYELAGRGLSVLSFHSDEGKRIYPDYFQVVKSNP